MSKLICVLLLLVVMVSFWCDNTVSASKWARRSMWRCRCKVLPNGKEICRKSLTDEEKLSFQKCRCIHNYLLKFNGMSFLDIQKKCNYTPKYPIPSRPIGFL